MKAISPLVATAILLIITIAGGVLLYNYMMNTLSAPQEYANIAVTSAKIYQVNTTTAVLNIQVVNMGTRTATINSITIIPGNYTFSLSNTLVKPGTSKNINIVIDNATIVSSLLTGNHLVIVNYNNGVQTQPVQIEETSTT